jgi:DNA-binding SARP family transcriptional activator
MEFRLLGPLEVVEHDRVLVLGGGRQRALFAVLLLHANEVVSADRLIDGLWGQTPPATAGKIVQVYVSRLRKELGNGRLVTRSPGYLLRVERSELDLARFEQFVAEAGRADPRSAALKLRRALALWRGPPLAEFAWAPFAPVEIARLEELHLEAVELRVEAGLAAGRHAELVAELQRLTTSYPWRERLHGQLMCALYLQRPAG